MTVFHDYYNPFTYNQHQDYVIPFRQDMYSVMQSDRNSFCGDVVLGSFNQTSWDEDNILDQIYKRKCVRIIVMRILILYNILRKCILTLQ